jgi:LysM repeat protein
MRQAKRLFYMILLNVIISAITVGVILQLWEQDHPAISADCTPAVIIVTPTQAASMPLIGNDSIPNAITPLETGSVVTGTVQVTPTLEMIAYQVKEGDTLGALAVQFNASIDDIMTVNGLTDPNSLYIGQIIKIPTAPLPRETSTAVPPAGIVSPTPRPSATPTHGPTLTPTATLTGKEAQVVIDTVIGAGVLANERLVLRRSGDGELSLVGWQMTDGKGNVYIFPQLTLYKDGAINLNTRTGQNTVVDLFWNLISPIWGTGKTVSLYDAQNNLRSTYTVP